MRNINMLLGLSAILALSGCVSNSSFTKEQLAIINQHKIVVKILSAEKSKPLNIYSRSGKVGSEVAQIALGFLLGGYKSKSSGNTPRTRFESASVTQALTESGRKASGEKIMSITPTQVIEEMLAISFDTVGDEANINKDNLTITVKTVAWHLYYDKMFNERPTYLLEYAADISMSAPNMKLYLTQPCDKQSEQALTKEEWLANDNLRIRTFADTVAKECSQQILSKLGKNEEKSLNKPVGWVSPLKNVKSIR